MNARRIQSAAAVGVLTGAALLCVSASASATIVYKPSSLSFAKQKVNTQSPVQQVDMGGGSCIEGFVNGMFMHSCNADTSDVAISGDFVITSNTCPTSLIPPGALGGPTISCSIGVAFKPKSTGPLSGFLRLQSSPSVVGVPLSGTGCKKKKTKSGKKKLVCKAKAKKKKK